MIEESEVMAETAKDLTRSKSDGKGSYLGAGGDHLRMASDRKSDAGYETGYQHGAGGSEKKNQLLYQSQIILGNDWLCVAGE